MKDTTLLLLPDKPDPERDALANCWSERYGDALRVGKFWVKPETQGRPVALYGNDSFCLVLAQLLGLDMVTPKDESLAELGMEFLKRHIEVRPLGTASEVDFPKFVKPVTPKLFKAKVYDSHEELLAATAGMKPEEPIMVSEIIGIEVEARTFVLNGRVQDVAIYEGEGSVEEAFGFAQDFLHHTPLELPVTFVMDLGFEQKREWFILEFNASWGAGLNACQPEKVVECIRAATINPRVI